MLHRRQRPGPRSPTRSRRITFLRSPTSWPASLQQAPRRDPAFRKLPDERGVICFLRLRAGMKIQLAQAVRQVFHMPRDDRAGHPPAGAQTEGAVSELQPVPFQMRNRRPAEALKNPRHDSERARFADEAHRAKTVRDRDGQRQPQDRRMEMEMGVAVPVAGRKTQLAKTGELRANLAPERLAERWRECVTKPGPRRRWRKLSVRIRELGNLRRPPGAEGEVEAHAQRGICAGDFRGFIGGRFIDHHAGLRDEPSAVGAEDGGVDLGAAAEVVGGDDELFQLARRAGKIARAAMTIWLFSTPPCKA